MAEQQLKTMGKDREKRYEQNLDYSHAGNKMPHSRQPRSYTQNHASYGTSQDFSEISSNEDIYFSIPEERQKSCKPSKFTMQRIIFVVIIIIVTIVAISVSIVLLPQKEPQGDDCGDGSGISGQPCPRKQPQENPFFCDKIAVANFGEDGGFGCSYKLEVNTSYSINVADSKTELFTVDITTDNETVENTVILINPPHQNMLDVKVDYNSTTVNISVVFLNSKPDYADIYKTTLSEGNRTRANHQTKFTVRVTSVTDCPAVIKSDLGDYTRLRYEIIILDEAVFSFRKIGTGEMYNITVTRDSIGRVTPAGDFPHEMYRIQNHIHFNDFAATLNIDIPEAKCGDKGEYELTVRDEIGKLFACQSNLEIVSYPMRPVVKMSPGGFVEGFGTAVYCEAHTGCYSGSDVQFKFVMVYNKKYIDTSHYTKTVRETKTSWTSTQWLYILNLTGADVGTLKSGESIGCQYRILKKSSEPYNSALHKVWPIPGNFCDSHWNDCNKLCYSGQNQSCDFYHPDKCDKYVTCYKNRPYERVCYGDLLFNKKCPGQNGGECGHTTEQCSGRCGYRFHSKQYIISKNCVSESNPETIKDGNRLQFS